MNNKAVDTEHVFIVVGYKPFMSNGSKAQHILVQKNGNWNLIKGFGDQALLLQACILGGTIKNGVQIRVIGHTEPKLGYGHEFIITKIVSIEPIIAKKEASLFSLTGDKVIEQKNSVEKPANILIISKEIKALSEARLLGLLDKNPSRYNNKTKLNDLTVKFANKHRWRAIIAAKEALAKAAEEMDVDSIQ